TVTDRMGATASKPLTVVITPDTTAPTVAVEIVPNLVANGSQTQIQILATDDVGVTRVELLVNGQEVQVDGSWQARYTVNLPAGPPSPAFRPVVAYAWDAADNKGTSDPASIQVFDPTVTNPPVASITAPANGATVTQPVVVTGTAEDNAANAGTNPTLA